MEEIKALLGRKEDEFLERLTKGQELINKTPVGSLRDEYTVHYNKLRNQVVRIQICLDILDESYTVIAERGGEIIVAKRLSSKVSLLIEEAQRLGARVVSIEEIKNER